MWCRPRFAGLPSATTDVKMSCACNAWSATVRASLATGSGSTSHPMPIVEQYADLRLLGCRMAIGERYGPASDNRLEGTRREAIACNGDRTRRYRESKMRTRRTKEDMALVIGLIARPTSVNSILASIRRGRSATRRPRAALEVLVDRFVSFVSRVSRNLDRPDGVVRPSLLALGVVWVELESLRLRVGVALLLPVTRVRLFRGVDTGNCFLTVLRWISDDVSPEDDVQLSGSSRAASCDVAPAD